VIGGDAVHRAVRHPLHQRLPVRRGTDGRIHLEPALVPQVVLAQQEIVGRGLTGDGQPLRLGAADERHALPGGDVADVIAAAGLPDQPQVPFHHAPFALGGDARKTVGRGPASVVDAAARTQQGVDLAVGDDGAAQRPGPLHGGAHQRLGLDAVAVVRKADHLRRQSVEIGQTLPALALGDRSVGQNADHGVPADQRQLRGEIVGRIRRRTEVGHGAHRRIPARGGRRRAGGDGFLIRKTRLPKMNVNIYETWYN